MNNLLKYSAIGIACVLIIGIMYNKYAKKSTIEDTSKVLIVGTNAEFPPFCFIQDGEIVGFDIDIVREVAQRLGKQLVIKDYPFEALLPEIQLGSVQVLAAGLTATPERAERMFFTKPYIGNDPFVIVTKDDSIQTTDNLTGKTVAVNDGYTADAYVSALPNVQILRLKTPIDALMALQHERVDAFVAARNTIDPILKEAPEKKLMMYEIPGTSENCALAIAKQYPALLSQIQQALDTMQTEGTIAAFKTKWSIR